MPDGGALDAREEVPANGHYAGQELSLEFLGKVHGNYFLCIIILFLLLRVVCGPMIPCCYMSASAVII